MKNAIYFILKARLGLKILKFLSSLCGYVEKPLRKIRLIWKFITSQPGSQTTAIRPSYT